MIRQVDEFCGNSIQKNPSKLFDTEIMIKKGINETTDVVKESKISNHWSSAVPKKCKRNAILGEIHWVHKISSNFEFEKINCIKKYSVIKNIVY